MIRKFISNIIFVSFILTNIIGPLPSVMADEINLPVPGVIVHLSPPLEPLILTGIKVHPDNPFHFDFILDKGESDLNADQLKEESTKLIKYFLASLTIPEKDLWVNLSPYEKDRIIPQSFGLTDMGRDLLAEDYMLKQITASLFYPDDEVGKRFWNRVYAEALQRFGTTNIPVSTFNKVWIVPETAVVYENAQTNMAYVVESRLKVMLEQDYLSLEKHNAIASVAKQAQSEVSALGSQIVREIVIPQLTKEVNDNKNFAQLRQVYNALILANWYKKKIKGSILGRVYANQRKISGINIQDPQEAQKIYQRYLRAFKKGVYNYIKEEQDPVTQESIPRKYFSGGMLFKLGNKEITTHNPAMLSRALANAAARGAKFVLVAGGVAISSFGFAANRNAHVPTITNPMKIMTGKNKKADTVSAQKFRNDLDPQLDDKGTNYYLKALGSVLVAKKNLDMLDDSIKYQKNGKFTLPLSDLNGNIGSLYIEWQPSGEGLKSFNYWLKDKEGNFYDEFTRKGLVTYMAQVMTSLAQVKEAIQDAFYPADQINSFVNEKKDLTHHFIYDLLKLSNGNNGTGFTYTFKQDSIPGAMVNKGDLNKLETDINNPDKNDDHVLPVRDIQGAIIGKFYMRFNGQPLTMQTWFEYNDPQQEKTYKDQQASRKGTQYILNSLFELAEGNRQQAEKNTTQAQKFLVKNILEDGEALTITYDGKLDTLSGVIDPDGRAIASFSHAKEIARPKLVVFLIDHSGSITKQQSGEMLRALEAYVKNAPEDMRYGVSFVSDPHPGKLEMNLTGKQLLQLLRFILSEKGKGATFLYTNIDNIMKQIPAGIKVDIKATTDGKSDISATLENGPPETDKEERQKESIEFGKKKDVQFDVFNVNKEDNPMKSFEDDLMKAGIIVSYEKTQFKGLEYLFENSAKKLNNAGNIAIQLPAQNQFHYSVALESNGEKNVYSFGTLLQKSPANPNVQKLKALPGTEYTYDQNSGILSVKKLVVMINGKPVAINPEEYTVKQNVNLTVSKFSFSKSGKEKKSRLYVVDRSGSMSQLDQLKGELKKSISQSDVDPYGLITFGGAGQVDETYEKDKITPILNQLYAEGGTPGWQALIKAFNKILADPQRKPVDIVIITDGEFGGLNEGQSMVDVQKLLFRVIKLGCTINVATTEQAYENAKNLEPRKGKDFLSTPMDAITLWEAVLASGGKVVIGKDITATFKNLEASNLGSSTVALPSFIKNVQSLLMTLVDKNGKEIEVEVPIDLNGKQNKSASIDIKKIQKKDVNFIELARNSQKWAARKNIPLKNAPGRDSAMAIKREGGIDLTAENMNVQTKGQSIAFNLPADFKNIDPALFTTFKPVIFKIVPISMTQLKLMLNISG